MESEKFISDVGTISDEDVSMSESVTEVQSSVADAPPTIPLTGRTIQERLFQVKQSNSNNIRTMLINIIKIDFNVEFRFESVGSEKKPPELLVHQQGQPNQWTLEISLKSS